MFPPDIFTADSPLPDDQPLASRAALTHWMSLRAGDQLPGRRDFDPMRVPKLIPDMCLVDVLADPLDFRFRLMGAALAENMVRDRTGERFSTIPEMSSGTEFWRRYAEVAATGRVSCSHVNYTGPNEMIRQCWDVLMPLASDGVTVDMILVHVTFIRR